MAEILLARSTGIEGFEKHVVVKRILPKFVDNQRFVTMFLDEARLAGRLQHQNIAQVYDIGEQDGQYFFAMEFLHGVDLTSLLRTIASKGQRLPLAPALTIIAGAAAGLHYAHEEVSGDGAPLNIVHRDISLANLVVTFGGGVKVVDFGIARAEFRNTETRAGALKGKRAYMSPEQCRSGNVDRRSDVYSLGIVLWELTTMERLFRRSRTDNDMEIMDRITSGDITPPRAMVSNYPASLERIVMRALATDRDQRYPTCKALLDDIEDLAAQERLRLSTTALASYLEQVFGKRDKPWRTGSNPVIDPSKLVDRTATKPGDTDTEDVEFTDVTEPVPSNHMPAWPRLPSVQDDGEEDDQDFAGATIQMRPDQLPDEVQEALPTMQFHPDAHPRIARQLQEALEQRKAELAAMDEEEAAPTNELHIEPVQERRRLPILAIVLTIALAIGLVFAIGYLD